MGNNNLNKQTKKILDGELSTLLDVMTNLNKQVVEIWKVLYFVLFAGAVVVGYLLFLNK